MSATPQPSPQQPAPTPPPRPAVPAEVAMSAMKPRPAMNAAAAAHANGAVAAGPPPPPRPLVVGSPLPVPVKGAPITSDADQAALWAEVGLEVNGVHNYDPRCIELSRSELEALHDEFLAHRKLFGFQGDNVRNQMEHLCFLIQNARDRYGASAYQYLHNRSVHSQCGSRSGSGSSTVAFQFVCALLSPIAIRMCLPHSVRAASSPTTVAGARTSTRSDGASRSA